MGPKLRFTTTSNNIARCEDRNNHQLADWMANPPYGNEAISPGI